MTTLKEAPAPPLDTRGWLRWGWRQLTSMRIALILLFLLAIASIPGSIFPQRANNPILVDQWIEDSPTWGAILERLGMFEVYGSVWFSAVYLLLFVSLVGCVLPRTRHYWHELRSAPPAAPRNLERLDDHASFSSALPPSEVLDRAEISLRGWRRRREGDWVSAEKGYLKEAGNLLFHAALLLILVSIAYGSLFGWRGNVIVREGQGFSNTLTQFDAWGGGRLVSPDDLAPFSFTLADFEVDFERGEVQRGAPRRFEALVDFRPTPADPVQRRLIQVNSPLDVGGAKVFLVGHGYAPTFIVRDGTGRIVLDDSVVFLPQDGSFTSTGVLKLPDASPQLGVQGLFLPTSALDDVLGPHSVFPAPDDPSVFLSAWEGDLGLDSGATQSIYTLKTDAMTQLGLEALRPGQSWTLPKGAGTIEFTGFQRWASFQIAHDPGKEGALAGAVLAMIGLVLAAIAHRRRIWVRARTSSGATTVEVAGLAKSDWEGLAAEVQDLSERIQGRAEST